MTARIAIIGAGPAGLGAAYYLRRQQLAGADISFTLYEQDTRCGGKVSGETVPDPITGEPFLIDGGPDCFSTYKQTPLRLARELGFEDALLPSDDSRKGTYIVRDDRPQPLPAGFRLFIPTELGPLLDTELLSEEGKKQMLNELWVPKKEVAPGALNEESLESFIVRRFGRETLDYFAEPFIGGVHAGDPKTMSLAASFPSYLEMEQEYGSLIRGTILAQAARDAEAAVHPAPPADPDEKPQTAFSTFIGGLQQMTDALADFVGAENIRTGTRVSSLRAASHPGKKTGGYVLTLERLRPAPYDATAPHPGQRNPHPPEVTGTEELEVDALIIATESFAAAQLTRDLDPRLAELYAAIPCSSSATASFAFDADAVKMPFDGFGILVPEAAGHELLAMTWSSTKWPGHAPRGRLLLRGFVGTPLNQRVMEKSDADLTALMLAEIRTFLGLDPAVEPLFSRFYRWTGGMTQYTIGHIDRVAEIEQRVAETPGLAVAGGCFHGIGVPNCLDGGQAAAEKLLNDLA